MVKKPVGIAVPDYTSFGIEGPMFGDLVFDHLDRTYRGSFERIPITVSRKADRSSETFTRENVRKRDVYVIHQCVAEADTHTATAQKIGDDLRRSDAGDIVLFDLYNPNFSYDKRKARQSINARIVGDNYAESGINRVFTYDAHSDALVLAFGHHCPLEILPMSRPLAHYFRERYELENVTVCAPDIGGYERAEIFSGLLKVPLIGLRKERDLVTPDSTEALEIVGDRKYIEGKKILIRDDVIRSGGSIDTVVKILQEAGASDEFYVVSTHLELCGEAKDVIRRNKLKVIGTNTRHHNFTDEERQFIDVFDISELTARLIYLRSEGQSISEFFKNYGPLPIDREA